MNVYRSEEVPELPLLGEYVSSISLGFCPFLAPATNRGVVTYSVYDLGDCDAEQVQRAIFYLGLIHTEILRRVRAETLPQNRNSVCENLIFRFDGEDAVDGKSMFGWPHWLLKLRYTGVGVLFGKFWKGEVEDSRGGIAIPPPPYHFLSIRSTVKQRDPAFFSKAPELLDTLQAATDSGQDVLQDIGDPAIKNALASLPTTPDDVLATLGRLEASGFYQNLVAQARKDKIA